MACGTAHQEPPPAEQAAHPEMQSNDKDTLKTEPGQIREPQPLRSEDGR
jgi:hypothetical protein